MAEIVFITKKQLREIVAKHYPRKVRKRKSILVKVQPDNKIP